MDWLQLTKWQRLDLLARHRMDVKMRAGQIKQKKLEGLVGVIVAKVLGI